MHKRAQWNVDETCDAGPFQRLYRQDDLLKWVLVLYCVITSFAIKSLQPLFCHLLILGNVHCTVCVCQIRAITLKPTHYFWFEWIDSFIQLERCFLYLFSRFSILQDCLRCVLQRLTCNWYNYSGVLFCLFLNPQRIQFGVWANCSMLHLWHFSHFRCDQCHNKWLCWCQ